MTICVHNMTITKGLKKSVSGSGKEVIVLFRKVFELPPLFELFALSPLCLSLVVQL